MKTLFFLLIVIFCLTPTNIPGCTFIKTNVKFSKKEARRYYLEKFKGAIFIGRVLTIKEVLVKRENGSNEIMNEVVTDVEKYWTGVKQSKMTVYTGTGDIGGDCSADFKIGERYFFNINRVSGVLWANFNNSSKIDSKDNKKQWKFFNKIFGQGKSFQNITQ